MLKLVLHHTYQNGRATDVSGANNHGLASDTTRGSGEFASALRFFGASRVVVPQSPKLLDLQALRVKVRCMWTPSSFSFDRHNEIISGGLCFQLMVTPGGGLLAYVRDQTATWMELEATGFIHTGKWQDIELRHDGLSTMQLRVDGQLVAARYDVPGPVGSVAPIGIAIGHNLIKTNHLRSFDGWIDDVQLAKREIKPDELLDPCCADLPTLDEAVQDARAAGMTADMAREILGRFRELEGEVRSAVIDGDQARAAQLSDLADLGTAAVQAADDRAALTTLARTADFMRERVPDAEIISVAQRAVEILEEAPYGDVLKAVLVEHRTDAMAPLGDLMQAFCFPRPPEGEPGGGPGPILLRPADPDTDQPDGTPPPIVAELPADDGEFPVDRGASAEGDDGYGKEGGEPEQEEGA